MGMVMCSYIKSNWRSRLYENEIQQSSVEFQVSYVEKHPCTQTATPAVRVSELNSPVNLYV